MWWIVGAVAVVVIIAAAIIYKRRKKENDMPQGIQIFDAGGNLIFDLSKSTTYVLGTGQTGTSNGTLSDSRITSNAWAVVVGASQGAIIPVFSAVNGSISWVFDDTFPVYSHIENLTFMYGVY